MAVRQRGAPAARYPRPVTKAVEFAEVRRRIPEFGERATVITVTPAGLAHVVTAVVEIGADRLLIRVGARTRSNLTAQPHLTLTWEPRAGGEYQLILDGYADRIGDPADQGVSQISIAIEGGILHRLAGLPEPGPSCIALAPL